MHSRSRGYSILAALVFVGILGGIAATINILTPSSHVAVVNGSQGAEAASYEARGYSSLSSDEATKACDQAKTNAISNGGTSPQLNQEFNKDAKENNKCIAAVVDEQKVQQAVSSGTPRAQAVLNKHNYKCVGESTKVYMSKDGKGTITSRADTNIQQGLCHTQYCDASGANCTEAKAKDGSFSIQNWAIGDKDQLKNFSADQLQGVANLGPLDRAQNSLLQDVFTEQKASLQTQIDENIATKNSIEDQIVACDNNGSCKLTTEDIETMKKQQANIDKENARLQEQMKSLTEAQKGGLASDVPTDVSSVAKPTGCDQPGAIASTCTPPGNYSNVQDWCKGAGKSNALCFNGNTSTFAPNNSAPSTPSNTNTSGNSNNPFSGLSGGLGNILSGLLKGLSSSGALSPQGPACSSDPNLYAQQQQQYQMQMQQYNYQLQQYNYQQQQTYYYGGVLPTPPTPPVGCTPNPQQNTCPAAPAQPTSGCANGSWQPVRSTLSNGQQCTSNWQCVPSNAVQPTAELSCQPKIADAGMTIALSFACANATDSTGYGFTTDNKTSGSTTTVLTPPASSTAANFALSCTNQNLSARAECTVQIARPSIILVANPRVVRSGEGTTIGWITTGMKSCVVSSAQLPAFTTQNASNTSPNGMATISALTTDIDVQLSCTSLGGNVRTATTSVLIATSTNP